LLVVAAEGVMAGPLRLRDLSPVETPDGFVFACPCGGDHHAGVRTSGPHAWRTVRGTYPDTLTLEPSIKVTSGPDRRECWHGFLTDGEMRPC
jgi:hypothetical protein